METGLLGLLCAHKATRAIAERPVEPENVEAILEAARLALLGFSHAATEFLVMKMQMAPYFEREGLSVTCLEQSDWWR